MERVSLTYSSLAGLCTPLAWTPPRRSVLDSAKQMKKERSLPSSTRLSRRSLLPRTPLTPQELTMTTLNSLNCTKNNNGTMMLAELENILANLGDEIPKEDVQKLFAELADPEDEDGFFPYMP